jgi:hypothetical protein
MFVVFSFVLIQDQPEIKSAKTIPQSVAPQPLVRLSAYRGLLPL